MTKYQDLSRAASAYEGAYRKYELDTREIISVLLARIQKYLKIPATRLKWEPFEEMTKLEMKENHALEISHDRKLILLEDGYYQFVMSLLFHSVKFVYVLEMKKDGGSVLLRHEGREFEIILAEKDSFNMFLDYIYENTKKVLETDFDNLLKGEGKKALGFIK